MHVNDPVTDKQKKFARDLGIKFRRDISFGELSLLITQARKNQPPTENQVKFAYNLGIEFDETTIKGWELRKLLDAEVARQSREALRDNPNLKLGSQIMYKGNPYTIDELNRRRWKLRLMPCFRSPSVRTVWVMILTVKSAEAVEVRQPSAS